MVSTLVSILTLCAAQGAPLYRAEIIFPFGPKHSHGSSIVETANGDLLACWFYGSGERKEDDVLIQGARQHKGEAAWSEPFLMADSQDLPDCNPVLFIDPRETLWLFWVAVQNNEWGGTLLKYRTATQYSKDGPPEWSWQDVIHCRPARLEELYPPLLAKVQEKYAELLKNDEKRRGMVDELQKACHDKLTQRLGWMTRLHPIMTSDKRMMLGLYSDVFNCSLAAFTEDWGTTWQFSEPILSVDLGNIQPSFVPKKDGHIVALMRDNGLPNKIRRAESSDRGLTWSEALPTDVPNPGSSVDCIVLKDGAWVLVCNDTANGRHILSAYMSDDEGVTWKWKRRLENFAPGDGSGSYPSVIQSADGAIHCTYSFDTKESGGQTIKHAAFNADWIRKGDPVEKQ